MSKGAEYKKFIESIRSGLGYWKSYSLLQFTSSLVRLMKVDKVQGKDLASRLGVSPAQVSKVLSGQENVTIETMAKFADALDAVVHLHVAKKGVQVQWRELPPGRHPERIVVRESQQVEGRSLVVDFASSPAYAKRTRARAQREASFTMVTPPELEEAYG